MNKKEKFQLNGFLVVRNLISDLLINNVLKELDNFKKKIPITILNQQTLLQNLAD